MTQLADAARAHQAATRAAVKALERHADAAKRAGETRAALAKAIVEAFQAGSTQAEIVATTGYSRERVRQILRAAGIDPGLSVERARDSRKR